MKTIINVIPRKAVFTVDLRDPDEQHLQAAERRRTNFLEQIAEREGVEIETEQLVRFQPVVFDAGLTEEVEVAVRRLGFTCKRMTSGAGHDAQMIERIAPAALIFVPSHEGISHTPAEHTDDLHLVQGAQLLLDVVQHRLSREEAAC